MKKLISILFATAVLATSMFAVNFTVGGNFNFGGTQSDDSNYHGYSVGTGAFFNMDLFMGLGLQAEVNISEDYVTVSGNSISFNENYGIVDMPVMLWWNAKLGFLGFGAGIGPNFSGTVSDLKNNEFAKNNNLTIGLAAGANVIFYIGNHFGIVAGAHGVFDFTPRFDVTEKKVDGVTTVTFNTEDWKRRSIYGTLGVEYRF